MNPNRRLGQKEKVRCDDDPEEPFNPFYELIFKEHQNDDINGSHHEPNPYQRHKHPCLPFFKQGGNGIKDQGKELAAAVGGYDMIHISIRCCSIAHGFLKRLNTCVFLF